MHRRNGMHIIFRNAPQITGVNDDYVSLTDIARLKTDGETNPVIANWMRRVDTLEYLKLWEQINNDYFKPTDFEGLNQGI